MDTPRFRTALLLIACIAIPLIAGFAGSIYTSGSIPGWYASLAKPFFTPPSWVFAPVWTCLYILMGISLFLVLQKGTARPFVKQGALLFFAQLALNLAWSAVFFGLHDVAAALAVLLVLVVLIVVTMLVFRRVSVPAAWLLVPYLAWCCCAVALNAGIWLLN